MEMELRSSTYYVSVCVSISLFTSQCQQQGTWLPDSDSIDLTASQGSANINKLSKVFAAAAGDVGWSSRNWKTRL